MKKKILLSLTAAVVAGSLVACGGASTSTENNSNNNANTKAESTSGNTTASEGAIRIANGKIEIDNNLKDLAAKYKELTGQEVVIESVGGGADLQATLKGYYQAGNMPDLFVIGGKGDYKTWDGMAADLSDTEFAKHTDVAFKDADGKVIGFPYAVEGYGITYNADILEKAGIDPSTLTSYSAYEEAFKKLDSMKDELGLQAVVSLAAESGQMYWSTGNHLFGYYLSGGVDRNDKTNYENFMKGEIDKDRMTQFGKFFNLLVQYADPQVLISGTYDDQLALWAEGKTAFITQGNWIDASLDQYNVTFNCGIAPFAFTEEEMTGVLADSPSWWLAYKDGKNLDAVKAFLDWLATSEEGQKGFVIEAGMVSPYNNVELKPELPLAKSLSNYISAGDTYAWDWSNMPEGTAMQYTGGVFEAFAKGEIDLDTFVELMETQIKAAVSAQQ